MAQGRVERTIPFRFGVEPFDIGMHNVSAVSPECKSPFAFMGKIRDVKVDVGPVAPTGHDR